MTIEAIIFDIGGVLNRLQPNDNLRALESRLGLANGDLLRLVFDNPVARESSLGRATREQIWDVVTQQLHLPAADFSKLETDVWACYWWDEELLAFARSLRPRYKTGILSNAWAGARQEMQEHINGDTFDVIVYSSEEGMLKPQPEIYLRTLERLGVAASEAIFIDDMQRNVDAAAALGMHGIVFAGSADVRAAIGRMLQS
jgi:FMN phosphatase YigB (HAD superfamily)